MRSLALPAILLLALAARLLYLFNDVKAHPNFDVPYPGLDAALYDGLAQRVADGDLALGDRAYHFSPPYAYGLGGLYALFGRSPWVARLFNVALGVGTVALVYGVARRGLGRGALLAALGAALYGPFLVFDTSAMKTTLGVFFVALSLWLVLRDGKLGWGGAGAAFGLAYAMHGPIGLFGIAVAVWLLVRRRFVACGLFVAGVAVAVLPFTIRNFAVDDPALVRGGSGIHFYAGNQKDAWGGYQLVEGVRSNAAGHFRDARRVAEDAEGRALSSREVGAFWRGRAWDWIGENPRNFALLCGKRALLALNAYEIPNNEVYAYLAGRSRLLGAAPAAWLLLAFGLAGWALAAVRRRHLVLHLFLLAQIGVLAASLVTWRYRLPLVLALWPLAGYFVAEVFAWARAGRVRALAGALALLLGAAALSQAPLVEEKRRKRHVEVAKSRMRRVKRGAELRRRLATMASEMERIQAWGNLSRMHSTALDWEGAVQVLREAMRHYPFHRTLSKELARVLDLMGEHAQAAHVRRTSN